ncbi:MAG: efflux RND transporter permease subunit [Spirochaetes bacterium]|nr:efflux RND transporter permease subunit [Spirochaetota bacterium]
MNLSKLSVKRPTTMLIIFVLLVGFGLYTSLNLTIDLFPQINPPVLFLFTNYPGAGPEQVEELITRPLESALSNVSNVEKIVSTSGEGISQIRMEFVWGRKMDEASNEVRDKIEYIKQYLPEEAETPMMFKFDPSMIPIMYLGVKGNRSPEDLRKIALDIIQPRLEAVEGVALATLQGGRERAIRVEITQNRLEAYSLTLTQVANMLRGQNVQISAGSIEEVNKNYLIQTSGQYKDIEEIKNTVVAYKGNSGNILMNPNLQDTAKVIRLRDIANVYDGLEKEEQLVFLNGLPSVFLVIQKQSGENSVRTAENVYRRLEKLKTEIPSNVSLDVIYDSTTIIKKSLMQVQNSALSGAFLAIIILFLFLRSFKSVIIISLSMPISIIITLMLMYFFGFTLNIMTLAGLALGVGMLVDNSIVILENIYRYREKGAKVSVSSILGSQEMITAVTASTLTTIVVFAPIILFKKELGMYGELFSGLSFTVVLSISSSLFVALMLVPMLTSKYLPISSHLERNLTGYPKIIDEFLNNVFLKLENLYKSALKFVLNHKLITIIVIFIILVVSLFGIKITGFELMPQSEEDVVQLNIQLPVGTKLDITRTTIEQIEQIIKKEVKGYKDIMITAGERSFHGFLGAMESHKGTIMFTLHTDKKLKKDSYSEIQRKLRKYFHNFPDVIFAFDTGPRMGGNAKPIDILIKSNDLDKARDTAIKIKELIKQNVPEAVEPDVDFKEGKPQVEIFIDRDKAYSLGLNIYNIGQEVRANVDGITASKFREGSSEYDIIVILDPKDRDQIPDLNNIFILNNLNERIPLSNFSHLEKTTGPVNINRENQMRVIHITADLNKKVMIDGKNKTVKLNEVEIKIRKLIKENIIQEEDLIVEFSGDYAEFIKYFLKLGIILLISIALVFGIMAAQFESLLDPFIIFFTIPLTIIGVIWIYLITMEQFSILAIVGLIVLVGVVVNNGIVLVDYTNLLMKRGYKLIDACVEAGGNRLRPILMTTLTTTLAIFPMALIKVEGADLSRSIAKTLFGGLIVSMFFTLFLIPVIYAIFNKLSLKRKEKAEIKRQMRLEIRKEKLAKLKEKETKKKK